MGEIADGVNALISLGRGDVTGAALSAASMLPIVGDAIGKGGKIARAAIKHGDEVLEAAGKQVDEVLESLLLRTQDVEASSSQQVGDTSNPVFRVSRKKHPNHARMLESYNTSPLEKQPCVMIYPGFLDLRLFDRLYENEVEITQLSDIDKVLTLLIDGPKSIRSKFEFSAKSCI